MAIAIPKAFFAYSASGRTLKEPIREAVHILNATSQVNIQTWEECKIGGKFVINTICDAIDKAKLFFADLTGFNANVMFELGYAIAHDKRIWLIFDTTYPEEKNMFNQLKVLTTVGYVSCSNSQHIVSGFYKDDPVADIENTIFRTAIEPSLKPGGYHSILYLKSQHENQAAMRISNLLQKKLSNRIIVDDPHESTVQTLTWYGSRVFGCNGLVCHFADPEREDAYLQTARHALVCGMAHGFGIPLLMLAEGEFLSPIDYREYLKHYNTAPEALGYLEEWLPPIEQALKAEQEATVVPRSTTQLATDLKNLRFGEYIAENEEERLVGEYFIPTVAYDDAVRGNQTVFVGRKGSGKTANLMKLEDELSKSQQNLVCVIKPQRYQMLGIVDLLRRYQHRNVKGYAIESLWKFLLLTEIANTAFNNLENSPFGPINNVEQSFYNFVRKNEEIICEDFPTRLETCVQNLKGAIGESNDESSYLPVSEALHSSILKQLREELGKFLPKEQRVAILVDNLDQAWEQQNDIEALSEILWGLLEVAKQLPDELEREDSRRQSIQLSLAIFLRSDIFYRIRKVAHEPDKMPYSLLRWDDPELLCRIIEERFCSSFEPPALDSDLLWKRYFCLTVNGISTREYITEAILKRPRDIIYLVNAAVTIAINRKHTQIEVKDILDAEKQYSQYAFDSVKVENTLPDINLENVIFEFVGRPAILTKSQVLRILQRAEISEEMIESTIDVLHDLTFLGLEVEGGFVFSDVPEESRKNKTLAQGFAEEKGQEERFQIHKAFQAFLETKEI